MNLELLMIEVSNEDNETQRESLTWRRRNQSGEQFLAKIWRQKNERREDKSKKLELALQEMLLM